MIGRDERAISRTAAAEHGQTKHDSISSGRDPFSQTGNATSALAKPRAALQVGAYEIVPMHFGDGDRAGANDCGSSERRHPQGGGRGATRPDEHGQSDE